MARTDHSKIKRNVGKVTESRHRQDFKRALFTGDFDSLPPRLPRRYVRTHKTADIG